MCPNDDNRDDWDWSAIVLVPTNQLPSRPPGSACSTYTVLELAYISETSFNQSIYPPPILPPLLPPLQPIPPIPKKQSTPHLQVIPSLPPLPPSSPLPPTHPSPTHKRMNISGAGDTNPPPRNGPQRVRCARDGEPNRGAVRR